jgi:hypothetical protein
VVAERRSSWAVAAVTVVAVTVAAAVAR